MDKRLIYILIALIIIFTIILLALFSLDILFNQGGNSKIGVQLAPELKILLGLIK